MVFKTQKNLVFAILVFKGLLFGVYILVFETSKLIFYSNFGVLKHQNLFIKLDFGFWSTKIDA